jgi:hypothetical protein
VAHRYLPALNLLGKQGGLESYTRETVRGSDSTLVRRITEFGLRRRLASVRCVVSRLDTEVALVLLKSARLQ